MYLMEIEEVYVQNLELNDINEVIGLPATKTLPKRLQFVYKDGRSRQMPLYHIKEGFKRLRIIHSSMKQRGNATLNAKEEIFNNESDQGKLG